MKRFFYGILLLLTLLLTSCVLMGDYIDITNGNSITIKVGESIQLNVIKTMGITEPINWHSSSSCVIVDNNGYVTGISEGIASITAATTYYSDSIQIEVVNDVQVTISLFADKTEASVGDVVRFDAIVNPSERQQEVNYNIVSGAELAFFNGNVLSCKNPGTVQVNASIAGFTSNTLNITIVDLVKDPYENMSAEEFYRNYTEASSYMDSYYRTLHGFMSGSIAKQDQKPTIASNQPSSNGMLLKNSHREYSSDGKTYFVSNEKGEIVNTIYEGGAYVTLEDVAAYLFAFGDVPSNYTSKKSGSPSSSIWGEYLRLNHSKFSGSTSKYPYEPELPNISGCGGDLDYYEIDLGTTGTDCDPSYDIQEYNDGYDITRGAARLVYARYDSRGQEITDVASKYVFYTYNHYNDFQEYLNYENGWGKMFGNITGGGTLSSKNDYNPTPYIPVILENFDRMTLSIENEVSDTDIMIMVITYKKDEEIECEI